MVQKLEVVLGNGEGGLVVSQGDLDEPGETGARGDVVTGAPHHRVTRYDGIGGGHGGADAGLFDRSEGKSHAGAQVVLHRLAGRGVGDDHPAGPHRPGLAAAGSRRPVEALRGIAVPPGPAGAVPEDPVASPPHHGPVPRSPDARVVQGTDGEQRALGAEGRSPTVVVPSGSVPSVDGIVGPGYPDVGGRTGAYAEEVLGGADIHRIPARAGPMDDGASRADRVDVVGRQGADPVQIDGDGIGGHPAPTGAVELRHHAASADRPNVVGVECRYRVEVVREAAVLRGPAVPVVVDDVRPPPAGSAVSHRPGLGGSQGGDPVERARVSEGRFPAPVGPARPVEEVGPVAPSDGPRLPVVQAVHGVEVAGRPPPRVSHDFRAAYRLPRVRRRGRLKGEGREGCQERRADEYSR